MAKSLMELTYKEKMDDSLTAKVLNNILSAPHKIDMDSLEDRGIPGNWLYEDCDIVIAPGGEPYGYGYVDEKHLSIVHIIIKKYIVDDKVFINFPNNIKFKKIILEIEFICLNKNLINKVKNLFSECKINVNKIVSHEYAKRISNNVSDDTMCLSAHKVISSSNQSEVFLESNFRKKRGIFYKIFNFFD